MALTNTILSRNVVGRQRFNIITVGFDASYPTGGEALAPADVGLVGDIEAVISTGAGAYGAGAYTVQYDDANGKLKAISLADGAEAGDTTDLSGFSINVIAVGR